MNRNDQDESLLEIAVDTAYDRGFTAGEGDAVSRFEVARDRAACAIELLSVDSGLISSELREEAETVLFKFFRGQA